MRHWFPITNSRQFSISNQYELDTVKRSNSHVDAIWIIRSCPFLSSKDGTFVQKKKTKTHHLLLLIRHEERRPGKIVSMGPRSGTGRIRASTRRRGGWRTAYGGGEKGPGGSGHTRRGSRSVHTGRALPIAYHRTGGQKSGRQIRSLARFKNRAKITTIKSITICRVPVYDLFSHAYFLNFFKTFTRTLWPTSNHTDTFSVFCRHGRARLIEARAGLARRGILEDYGLRSVRAAMAAAVVLNFTINCHV